MMTATVPIPPGAVGPQQSKTAAAVARTIDDELPCQAADSDLWFAETPGQLEKAKQLCANCPIRNACLQSALSQGEPWGVWGGEIFERGTIIARKRPRGRPRKTVSAA